MKNLMKSTFVALVVSMFVVPASAGSFAMSPANLQDTVVKKDTVVKEVVPQTVRLAQNEVTYTKIEVAEVPENVVKAVAMKYEGYTIEEAYKGSDNSYKLVIKKDTASLTVYYSESGEFQKEEAVVPASATLI